MTPRCSCAGWGVETQFPEQVSCLFQVGTKDARELNFLIAKSGNGSQGTFKIGAQQIANGVQLEPDFLQRSTVR